MAALVEQVPQQPVAQLVLQPKLRCWAPWDAGREALTGARSWARAVERRWGEVGSRLGEGPLAAVTGQASPWALATACEGSGTVPTPLASPAVPEQRLPDGFSLCHSRTFLSIQLAPAVASSCIPPHPRSRAPTPAAFTSCLHCMDLTNWVCTASAGFAPAPCVSSTAEM